jgi:hypothetical protein
MLPRSSDVTSMTRRALQRGLLNQLHPSILQPAAAAAAAAEQDVQDRMLLDWLRLQLGLPIQRVPLHR